MAPTSAGGSSAGADAPLQGQAACGSEPATRSIDGSCGVLRSGSRLRIPISVPCRSPGPLVGASSLSGGSLDSSFDGSLGPDSFVDQAVARAAGAWVQGWPKTANATAAFVQSYRLAQVAWGRLKPEACRT